MRMLNTDLMVNYFAVALDCSPMSFFKKAEETNEEYASLLDVDYSSEWELIKKVSGKTECVIMPVEIKGNPEILKKRCVFNNSLLGWPGDEPYLSLCKEKNGHSWEYTLKLNEAAINLNAYDAGYQKRFGKNYLMCDMNGSDRDFTLAIDKNGKLKDFFEKNIYVYWTKIAEMIPVSDVRFHIWIGKLTKATQQGLIGWRKSEYGVTYYGDYADKKIEIDLPQDSISRKDTLYIRFTWDYVVGFTILTEKELTGPSNTDGVIEELRELSAEIEKSIKIHEEGSRINVLPQKELEYSDVIAVTNSMICKESHHIVIPYKGLVPFLNKENEIVTYTIYVGYCKGCKRFYMFESDFEKMHKEGKPLCRVIRLDKNEPDKDNFDVDFKYKSESVLHALGYNVRANNNLSTGQRQKILIDAVEKELLQVHEILDFLNWLVRVNESKKGHSKAVSKRKEDIEFIKSIALKTEQTTHISTIYVKN